MVFLVFRFPFPLWGNMVFLVVGFPFSLWGNEGKHNREMLFVSFPFPVILIFPCGKTEESGIRSQAEKLFLAKSFSLCNLPLGACKFTFQKCALRKGCFAHCDGRPKSLPLESAIF